MPSESDLLSLNAASGGGPTHRVPSAFFMTNLDDAPNKVMAEVGLVAPISWPACGVLLQPVMKAMLVAIQALIRILENVIIIAIPLKRRLSITYHIMLCSEVFHKLTLTMREVSVNHEDNENLGNEYETK